MKYVLTPIFCLLSAAAFAQLKHPSHSVHYDSEGKIFWEEIYNVHNRGPEDVVEYARSFVKKQPGATIVAEDKEDHTITVQFKWKFDDASKNHKLYGIIITPNIVFAGKTGRTRVYVSNLTFTGGKICGKEGPLEQVYKCDDVSKHQKTEISVFLNEKKVDRLMEEYKEFLVEAVRKGPKEKSAGSKDW
jgi:hypothetical protein